ncbi:MAG: HD domain-containing protein [Thermoguttaceae bacterium]
MTIERLRRRVAFEAARLIYAREETQYGRAKLRAVRRFTAGEIKPEDMPCNREIRGHLRAFDRAAPDEQRRLMSDPAAMGESAESAEAATWCGVAPSDRFRVYELLLLPLEHVAQPIDVHPEGDVLYHSLQVFELAREMRPYDEEFLLAALLHDVGKAIDRRDHVEAGLAALEGFISPRTAWLIEHHVEALALREGTLGVRVRRRLETSEDFEELLLLCDCDRRGRMTGVAVPDVQEAIDQIRQLSDECGD